MSQGVTGKAIINFLINHILARKIKYFGHIKRHDSFERTILLKGRVSWKQKKRGRPKRRWIQDINETLDMTTVVNYLVRDRTGFTQAVKKSHRDRQAVKRSKGPAQRQTGCKEIKEPAQRHESSDGLCRDQHYAKEIIRDGIGFTRAVKKFCTETEQALGVL
jgi:hypothetical protein